MQLSSNLLRSSIAGPGNCQYNILRAQANFPHSFVVDLDFLHQTSDGYHDITAGNAPG